MPKPMPQAVATVDGEHVAIAESEVEHVRVDFHDADGHRYCTSCGQRWASDEDPADIECLPATDDHTLADTPLSWANSASITLNPQLDEITVTISAGDPRSGLQLTVARTNDGHLLVFPPHAHDGNAHMPSLRYVDPAEPAAMTTRPDPGPEKQ